MWVFSGSCSSLFPLLHNTTESFSGTQYRTLPPYFHSCLSLSAFSTVSLYPSFPLSTILFSTHTPLTQGHAHIFSHTHSFCVTLIRSLFYFLLFISASVCLICAPVIHAACHCFMILGPSARAMWDNITRSWHCKYRGIQGETKRQRWAN